MSFGLKAQNLEEGTIKVVISEVNSDNEQMAAQLEMLKGSETAYHFNKDKSLVTAEMMGGMIKIKSLVNNADEHMTLLFDAMGQKMMIESTKEERDKSMTDEAREATENMKVTYDKSDTKKILGYDCIKANISGGDESPMKFSMYVSKDIKASNKMIQGLQGIKLEGFPLEYIMEMPEMSMTYTASEILKSVDSNVFNVETSGFTKMTFEEFTQQMGAFGGGMGF